MAKRRDFLVSFNFTADRAGEFFKLFAPFMEHADNFECTTVTDEVPDEEPRPRQARVSASHAAPPVPVSVKGEKVGNPWNPHTAEEVRERFRLAQRGLTPSASQIITKEFEGKDSFLLEEARELLYKNGLSVNTASPTLNNMRARGEVDYVDTKKFRIRQKPLTNGNGGIHEGESPTANQKGL